MKKRGALILPFGALFIGKEALTFTRDDPFFLRLANSHQFAKSYFTAGEEYSPDGYALIEREKPPVDRATADI
jgi:hypothetical protein